MSLKRILYDTGYLTDYTETENDEVAEEATDNQEKRDKDDDSPKQFECMICDFKSNWENGLKVHMSRKHATIDQLDGHTDECVEDDKYSGSKHYWMKGWWCLPKLYRCLQYDRGI